MTLLEQLVRDKIHQHPLPWTIDYDWCVEVIDSSGRVVSKLMHRDMAVQLIGMAERITADDASFSEEFERMISESAAD